MQEIKSNPALVRELKLQIFEYLKQAKDIDKPYTIRIKFLHEVKLLWGGEIVEFTKAELFDLKSVASILAFPAFDRFSLRLLFLAASFFKIAQSNQDRPNYNHGDCCV